MKYKIIGEPEVRNGDYGEFKIASLEGPAGQTHHGVFFGNRGAGYKFVVPTGEVEGEIDVSGGKGKKFVFPRSGGAFAKKDPKEEEVRSKRIAFLACTERAIEAVNLMLTIKVDSETGDKAKRSATKELVRNSIVDWREWFISEFESYNNKISK